MYARSARIARDAAEPSPSPLWTRVISTSMNGSATSRNFVAIVGVVVRAFGILLLDFRERDQLVDGEGLEEFVRRHWPRHFLGFDVVQRDQLAGRHVRELALD